MRFAWLPIVLLTMTPAVGQTPHAAPPESAAVLRALEKINARLDRLEKETQGLKAQLAGTGGTAPAPGRPSETPSAKVPPRSVPGWFVSLIPFTEDRSGVPVGGFPAPLSDLNFDMHTRYLQGQNRFIYSGVSNFDAKEDGNYVFAITLEPVGGSYNGNPSVVASFNCAAEVKVNDNPIISGETKFDTPFMANSDFFRTETIFGQVRLTPEADKKFVLKFHVDCWPRGDKNVNKYDVLLPLWKKNRFKILVKTPADPLPRPFLPSELYYVGKPS